MKKLIPSIMVACLLSLFVTGNLSAENQANKSTGNSSRTIELANIDATGTLSSPQMLTPFKKAEIDRAVVLMNRVYSIKAMDISAMDAADRKALRKELRCIKNELTTVNSALASGSSGGVYLSVGAIIIIILLILLL